MVSGNEAIRSSKASARIGYTRTMLLGKYTAGRVGTRRTPTLPMVGSTYSTCAIACAAKRVRMAISVDFTLAERELLFASALAELALYINSHSTRFSCRVASFRCQNDL